uniref:Uncharacterized protein n=1 Tax=Lactuca sativa TaxID=4236 RepID=A0A9R1WY56_LACSA|nr:hypothetical protein LSAT_V11C800451970 [Lactuca sativa]
MMSGLDLWTCGLSTNEYFSFEACRCRLNLPRSGLDGSSFVWLKEVPIKASCFVSHAVQNCIPTALALRNRGINIVSSTSLLVICCARAPLPKILGNEIFDSVVYQCIFLLRQVKC